VLGKANPLHRSGCPESVSLETLGDRWSLLIVLEIMERDRAAVQAESYRRWEQRDPTPLIPPFKSSVKSPKTRPPTKGKSER
jgi:hypothetical protein